MSPGNAPKSTFSTIDPRSIPRHFALFSFLQQRPKHNDRRFTMKITPLQMYKLANRRFIHRKSRWKYSRMGLRQFASFFGCTPAVAAAIWNRIEKKDEIDVDPNFTPTKLLWTLLFLKTYLSETVLATLCRGCTEKTLRKWVWIGIDILGDLDLVCGCAVSCRVVSCRAVPCCSQPLDVLLLFFCRSSGRTGT